MLFNEPKEFQSSENRGFMSFMHSTWFLFCNLQFKAHFLKYTRNVRLTLTGPTGGFSFLLYSPVTTPQIATCLTQELRLWKMVQEKNLSSLNPIGLNLLWLTPAGFFGAIIQIMKYCVNFLTFIVLERTKRAEPELGEIIGRGTLTWQPDIGRKADSS